MADYDVKIDRKELVDLLTDKEALPKLLEGVLNQVLEAQLTEHLGADFYEHKSNRNGYRNGYRTRQLYTRVGTLTLQVPQTRDGSFSTEIFKRFQRSEQALVSSLMEMYIDGVSTRKVTKITEELCGASFSKSTVSTLCMELDAKLEAWRGRRLSDKKYPFIIVDALVTDIRRNGSVQSSGVLIAHGITEDGKREPLDLLIADSESAASWEDLFKKLRQRGLHGVELVVSDNHSGLVKSIKKYFQGARWQRCQVHFIRNILDRCPRKMRKELASQLRLVFHAENLEMAKKLSRLLMDAYENKAPKAMEVFDSGLQDALTVLELPVKYRQRLRTSNLAERVNEEIRRRERIIRVFPNDKAAERLIGAILVDIYEDWQDSAKYFEMTEFYDWLNDKELSSYENQNNKVVLLN